MKWRVHTEPRRDNHDDNVHLGQNWVGLSHDFTELKIQKINDEIMQKINDITEVVFIMIRYGT